MSINYTKFTDNPIHFDQIHDLLQSEESHMLVLSVDEIKEFIGKEQAIIALENDKVIGFVKYFSHGIDQDLAKEILECGSLVVDSQFRGQGVAQNLIKNLVKNIKSDSILVGVVRKTNQASFQFFKKINAKEIKKSKQLILYPLGSSEETFHFFNLNNIK